MLHARLYRNFLFIRLYDIVHHFKRYSKTPNNFFTCSIVWCLGLLSDQSPTLSFTHGVLLGPLISIVSGVPGPRVPPSVSPLPSVFPSFFPSLISSLLPLCGPSVLFCRPQSESLAARQTRETTETRVERRGVRRREKRRASERAERRLRVRRNAASSALLPDSLPSCLFPSYRTEGS